MRKSTKVWLITATALVFGGGIIFAGVMSTLGWDFAKLSTVRYETNTYEIGETFSNISLTSDNADIIFALSDDGKCRVECYDEENAKHSAGVENDTLTVKVNSQKLWYDYIGLSLNSPRITVYLPKTEYNALFISESTGDITLSNVIAKEKISVERSTGDVKFNGCDATEIYVRTNTGDVTGSLLSNKTFIADTNLGDVDVPKNGNGGKCEIITDVGDIRITVEP